MTQVTVSDSYGETTGELVKADNFQGFGLVTLRLADGTAFRTEGRLVTPTIECETCCGSGMVAYGRWGSRPPHKPCEVCNGKGRVAA